MSQQINLYNPIFRKKGFSYTSATAMLYGVGIAIALAALVAVYEDYQLRGVQTQARATDQAYKDATANHEKLTAEVTKRKPNAQLEAEVAALDARLTGRQEIIDALKSGAVGNIGGFSDYMRAFSRQIISGLWLTGFDIALGGNELAIQGRTLSADLVASYLKQLNQEKALQGRRFASMRIDQPPPDAASLPKAGQKADKSVPDQKASKEQKSATPRYLEFTISTMDIPASPRPMTKSAATEMPLLGPLNPAAAFDAAKAGAGQGGAR
jgi:hypothetical protein